MFYIPLLFGNIPYIPFLHRAEEIIFFAFLFIRVAGLFWIAPFLDNRTIPQTVRMMLIFFTTVLLCMVLYPDYLGDYPKYHLAALEQNSPFIGFQLALTAVKEVCVGYLIGFCFAMIYEAVYLAGFMITNVTGLSYSAILDPLTGTSQTILTQLLLLATSFLILITDLHHTFFALIKQSFNTIPIGSFEINSVMVQDLIHGSSHMFLYGLQIAIFPTIILLLVTVGLGFMSRVMPEVNIFMIAFPIKIFIGFYALIIALAYFPTVLQQAFIEYSNLVTAVLYHLMPSHKI
ncbi:MAG: flagellar biosynthetic protein FliR [Chlamydiales bacterium]|jgi:flagellar biosynthetic protein FliR|nr:flagellar biosynthetic protein FliR [Chlamydiales bacterium]